MYKHYKAIESETLSKPNDPRYIVIDVKTGEVVDDAGGYGFKSKVGGYARIRYVQKRREARQKGDVESD